MQTILETERLIAREILPLDASALFKLNADPKVILHTGDKAFQNEAEALKLIENTIIQNQYKAHGYGRWAVHLQANGLFIGWCGLRKEETTQKVDLGFRFHKRFWNKGFATEMGKACIEYGFENVDLKEIYGNTQAQNTASIRVLEKLGMEPEGQTSNSDPQYLSFKIVNNT